MSKFKKGDRVVVIDSLLYNDCEVLSVEQIISVTIYTIKNSIEELRVSESQVFAKDDQKGIIQAIRGKIMYWEGQLKEETDKVINDLK